MFLCEPYIYILFSFLQHPGGLDIILENAGRDCTGVFQDVGHSKWASKLLLKFKIGMLNEVSIYTAHRKT